MNAIDEFRFPCFVDICTFPYQYCNSDADERRCNYCTVPICTSDFIPDPCKYYCKSLKSTKTPTTTTPSLIATSMAPSSSCPDVTPDIPFYTWSIILFLTIALVALSLSIIFVIISRRKKSKLLIDERMEQGENKEMKLLMKPLMNEPDSASDCSDLTKNSLSSTSCSGPISQPEDSLHGNHAASSGPPPYANESTKESKETLKEHQKCTKSKTLGPIQRQCSRSASHESECSSNPTLPVRGDLCDSSLFVSSSEGHIPERKHCCRELDSRKSDK